MNAKPRTDYSLKAEWIKSGAYHTMTLREFERKQVDSWFIRESKKSGNRRIEA
jgi:hypothetical protein